MGVVVRRGASGRRSAGDVLVELTLRPQVAMGAFQALGFVCVLGVVEGLRELGFSFTAVGWPQSVVDSRTDEPLCALALRAGYDKGMYCHCTVVGERQVGLLRTADDEELAPALTAAIERRVKAWEEQIVAGAGAVGPIAPIMTDYFDAVALMGRTVSVRYPNGREMAQGTLSGIDAWGRATVKLGDGKELELAPEQASIVRNG